MDKTCLCTRGTHEVFAPQIYTGQESNRFSWSVEKNAGEKLVCVHLDMSGGLKYLNCSDLQCRFDYLTV